MPGPEQTQPPSQPTPERPAEALAPTPTPTPQETEAARQAAKERTMKRNQAEAEDRAREQAEFQQLYGGLDPPTASMMQEQAAPGEKKQSTLEAKQSVENQPQTSAQPTNPEEASPTTPEASVNKPHALPSTPEAVEARVQQISQRMQEIDKQLRQKDLNPELKDTLQSERQDLQREMRDLIPSKNIGEKLERDMDKAMDDFRAGDPMAFVRGLAALMQYFHLAKTGELDKPIGAAAEKNPEGNKDGQTGAGGLSEGNDNDRLTREIDENARNNRRGTTEQSSETTEEEEETAVRNIEDLREKKRETIEKNKETLATLDKKIDATKDENKNFIAQKSQLEQQLNDMRGDESKADDVAIIEAELEAVTQKIEINNKFIDKLDKQSDKLKEVNKKLEKDVTNLDARKAGVEKGFAKIAEMVALLGKIWNEKNPGQEIPKVEFTFNPDGSLKGVTFGKGVADNVSQGKKNADGSITMTPEQIRDAVTGGTPEIPSALRADINTYIQSLNVGKGLAEGPVAGGVAHTNLEKAYAVMNPDQRRSFLAGFNQRLQIEGHSEVKAIDSEGKLVIIVDTPESRQFKEMLQKLPKDTQDQIVQIFNQIEDSDMQSAMEKALPELINDLRFRNIIMSLPNNKSDVSNADVKKN